MAAIIVPFARIYSTCNRPVLYLSVVDPKAVPTCPPISPVVHVFLSIMGMSTSGAPTPPAVIARDLKLLAAMEKFATAPGCRRKALLGYFGEDMGEKLVCAII